MGAARGVVAGRHQNREVDLVAREVAAGRPRAAGPEEGHMGAAREVVVGRHQNREVDLVAREVAAGRPRAAREVAEHPMLEHLLQAGCHRY